MKFKLLMDKLSYRQKTVKELKRIVSRLSEKLMKVDRDFLKSLRIYCTRSALNKHELIKVIDWFVVIGFIKEIKEWNIYILHGIALNDDDLKKILGIDPSDNDTLYKVLKLHFVGRITDTISPNPLSNRVDIFDKWVLFLDPEKFDDFLQQTKGNLWGYGNGIEFSPKYFYNTKLLNRKKFDKEYFGIYIITIKGCTKGFEITTNYSHGTFVKDITRVLKFEQLQ